MNLLLACEAGHYISRVGLDEANLSTGLANDDVQMRRLIEVVGEGHGPGAIGIHGVGTGDRSANDCPVDSVGLYRSEVSRAVRAYQADRSVGARARAIGSRLRSFLSSAIVVKTRQQFVYAHERGPSPRRARHDLRRRNAEL